MAVPSQPVASKIMLVVIWIAMLIACIIYWIIADYFMASLSREEGAFTTMRIPMAAIGIVSILVGLYFGWGRTNPRDDERLVDYWQRVLTSMITCMACFEAVAIYGLVLHFMGDPFAHRIFIAVGFVLLLLAGVRIGPIYSHYESLKEMEDARRF